MKRLAFVVLVFVGCEGSRDLPEVVSQGGASGSGVASMGGQGESDAIGGVGGEVAPVGGAGGRLSEAISTDFTRRDHDICVFWPRCPDAIIASGDPTLARVSPNSCRDTFHIQITCGACVDTSTPECKPFVGHCMALNWPQVPTDYCADKLIPSNPYVDQFTICTGPANGPDGGIAAHLVCDDVTGG